MEPEFGISNQLIVDAFADRLSLDVQAIITYIEENKFIADRIKERYAERHLFRQPSILLGYYLVDVIISCDLNERGCSLSGPSVAISLICSNAISYLQKRGIFFRIPMLGDYGQHVRKLRGCQYASLARFGH